MFTTPLHQLLALSETERRAHQHGEGERLGRFENAAPPASETQLPRADSLSKDRQVLALWQAFLDTCRRRLGARSRRPRPV